MPGTFPALEFQAVPEDRFSHSTEVAVRFAETDAQGIAHNAAYIVWYEVARVDYLARFAGGYNRIRGLGLEALTIETHVRYLGVVHFDDRTETIEGGQAYYIAPGHAIEFLEDSEALEFTPTAALERTLAAIRRNSAAADSSEA